MTMTDKKEEIEGERERGRDGRIEMGMLGEAGRDLNGWMNSVTRDLR